MTDKQEILGFIIQYIFENAAHEVLNVSEGTDFVEEGLLDSFAILNLIMTLESHFSVKFEPAELANPDLRVVGGLAKATLSKISA